MRQLLPEPVADIEPYDAYRPGDPSVPRLRLNMVASADGRAVDARGRTAGLTGPADRAVFSALRALADVIMVGAGTVRAEGYGPHRLKPELGARRRADGRQRPAPIIVVSRSLDLDVSSRLFTEAVSPTMILTCAAAPPDRRRLLSAHTPLLICGDDEVDIASGLRLLASEHGLNQVLCEGGPTLNTTLLRAGVVDELCLTLSPLVSGTEGPTMIRRSVPGRRLELLRLLEQDGELLMHYRLS